jgi:hypothetical protein
MQKVLRSALKHHLTERQILEDYADPLRLVWAEPDLNGIPQDLIIGSTVSDSIIEIKVKYTNDADIIFHAQPANAKWKSLYLSKR